MQFAQDGNLIKQRSICLTGSLVAAPWSLRHDSCTSTRLLGVDPVPRTGRTAVHPKSRRGRRSLAITANCSACRRIRGLLVVHHSPGVGELNFCCLEALFASCGIAKTAELEAQRTLHRCRCGKNPNRWARERKIEYVSAYRSDGARSRDKLR